MKNGQSRETERQTTQNQLEKGPFLIAPLVFSHVYLILYCFSSSYVLYVASFLDCPFLIAPLVFSHVYLIPPHFIEVFVSSIFCSIDENGTAVVMTVIN
jgi:hypothetical protein